MKSLLAFAVLGAAIYVKRCDAPAQRVPHAQRIAVDSTYYQAQRAWHGTPPRHAK